MANTLADNLSLFSQLTGKLALELVFAEAGKDGGLLPINSLLSEIEELASATPPPAEIQTALKLARQWIDKIFDTTGLFDADTLKRLSEWSPWMENAWAAVSSGGAIAPVPAGWSAQTAAIPSSPAVEPIVTRPAEEEPLHLNLQTDGELLREFTNESHEHLQNVEQGVLVLEENPTDADTLNATFRAFHTFKGGSGFLNLIPIKNLAHELESMLDHARQQKLAIDSEVINIILTGGDTLKQFVTEIELQLNGAKPPGPILVPTQALHARIRAVLEGKPASVAAPAPVAVAPAAPVAVVPAASPAAIVATPDHAADAPKNDPVLKPAKNAEPAATKAGASAGGTSVKVDTQKLDGLVDLVGEMVIAQSLVAQDTDLNSLQSQQLTRNLAQLNRITKELQRIAMSLRMVPIRSTFQKMNRLIRDTAAKMGKQVELVMEGEDTELDRTIVEEISDPLIHMIRNSIDHGIEKPDARISRGKPAQGTVWLRSFYQGGNIVIEIKDDGAGMNKDKLLAKALEKGLISPAQQLSEKEIFSLIFAAGFSTAEKVTDISGRGVGMDVVRRNIEKLRGKIDTASTLGEGSTFTIYLPLTLAIIDGLIVSVGHERYILPTLSVCESFRPSAGMISTVHERGEMVNVRGRLSPLLRLYDYFDVQPKSTDPTQGIVIVIESGQEKRCLLVDQLLGKQEVVIKNLGETFKQNRALAGAAILGDGRVGLILDPQALVQLKTEPLQKAA